MNVTKNELVRQNKLPKLDWSMSRYQPTNPDVTSRSPASHRPSLLVHVKGPLWDEQRPRNTKELTGLLRSIINEKPIDPMYEEKRLGIQSEGEIEVTGGKRWCKLRFSLARLNSEFTRAKEKALAGCCDGIAMTWVDRASREVHQYGLQMIFDYGELEGVDSGSDAIACIQRGEDALAMGSIQRHPYTLLVEVAITEKRHGKCRLALVKDGS
ncbi:hypothetical protein BDP27DRAFT_1367040 [Rhodocollybia butyracea]|uniref:Uncharacterized protein n=1 Tax=Rhodocollybia butyracea TaxID=206335 RepID=A0A9P5U3K9_9AGAR|nr:hypothetical protein BDP27DRAFT_1367040 [Rhodocollybia butyracea]